MVLLPPSKTTLQIHKSWSQTLFGVSFTTLERWWSVTAVSGRSYYLQSSRAHSSQNTAEILARLMFQGKVKATLQLLSSSSRGIFFPLMLLWVIILSWMNWRRSIPLHPPLTMTLWLTLSFLHQKLAIRWYLKDFMEQLFVNPASKLREQQVHLALTLLVGGTCAPPSSLFWLIYVNPLLLWCKG